MIVARTKNVHKMRAVTCILLMLNAAIPDTALAQVKNSTEIVPLKVGDQLGDVPISPGSVLNHSGSVSRLSDITAKKSVILDFFATWCSPCVAELPHLDSLQRAFGDRLQIVVITYESRDKVAAFLKSNRTAAGIRLPIITGDTLLRATFPHKVVPHEVWLNNNIVMAITTPEHITAPAIAQLINGQLPQLPVKYEDVTFNPSTPIFERGNGGTARRILYRSTLTGYLDGLSSSIGQTPEPHNQVSRLFAVNTDIFNLCKRALGIDADYYPPNRVQIQASNPERIKFDGENYEQWKLSNTYTYELQGPPTSPEKLQQLMLDDLRRYLNVVPAVEWKEEDVYLLKVDSAKTNALRTTGATPDENLYVKDGLPKYVTNKPVTFLVDKLNRLSPLPIINETHLSQNIDLRLPANISDFPTLLRHLSSYGLNLILSRSKVKVLVIREVESLTMR